MYNEIKRLITSKKVISIQEIYLNIFEKFGFDKSTVDSYLDVLYDSDLIRMKRRLVYDESPGDINIITWVGDEPNRKTNKEIEDEIIRKKFSRKVDK